MFASLTRPVGTGHPGRSDRATSIVARSGDFFDYDRGLDSLGDLLSPIMRVALFYFFYLATTGISLPYFTKYLDSLGYSGKQIVAVTSLSPVLGIFVPLIWGFAADRTGSHVRLLKLAVLGTAVMLVPLYFAHSFYAILGAWACYAFFTSAILPLVDTVAVVEAKRIGTDYSRLRMWGSISFIGSSFGFGQYLKAGGSVGNVPGLMLGLASVAVIVVQVLKQPEHPPHRVPPSLKDAGKLAAQPALLWFFIAGMIHQAALSPYYVFYGIHLGARGLGQDIVGWSFGLGVAAEVIMLYAFRHIFKRVPLFPAMAFSFVLSAARWALTARVENGALMASLQMIHAFTFAFCYAGSIAHLEHNVDDPLRATGRALFSAISLGSGSVLGHALAGVIKDSYGSSAAFDVAAGLEFVALIPLYLAAHYTRNALAETSETIEEEAADA